VRYAALIAVLAALLAGCGGSEQETGAPETVVTTGETETGQTTETNGEETETSGGAETETSGGAVVEGDAAAGKEVFASNGCGSCHKFTPAGSSGTTGPDLDELPDLAENANQPLAEFTRTSITNPNDYVEEGFPEGVMPAYDQLSEKQLNDLVAFLVES
jgi:mono/diheme cytochrome c family protein